MGLNRTFNFRNGLTVGPDYRPLVDSTGNLSAANVVATSFLAASGTDSGEVVTNVVSAKNIFADGNITLNPGASGSILSGGKTLHEIFLTPSDPLATTVVSNSASWNLAEAAWTTITSQSADWISQEQLLLPLSANWSDTYTTVSTTSSNWNTAYGWGDHASVGYLTSVSIPTSSNWNTAYGWGDHASAGYLTTIAASSNWNTAYTTVSTNSASWDHASVGYLTSVSIPTSANWNTAYTTVSTNSASWSESYTAVDANSADWNLGQTAWTTIQSNSASWLSGGSSGTGGNTGGTGVGAAGIFITDITCGAGGSGITQKTLDTDEIPVDNLQPVLSAIVDSSDVRFYAQWEGSSTEWTGSPTISGVLVPRANTTAVAGDHARRFEGYVDLDLSAHVGTTVQIPYTYEGVTRYAGIQLAGAGPVVTNLEITSSPQFSQDHYKDGDDITFVVEFDTTDVSFISLFGGNDFITGQIDDMNVTMNGLSATVVTSVDTTISTKQLKPIKLVAKNSFGTEGAPYTSSGASGQAQVLNGPVITNVTFGAYPTTFQTLQTELKDGDQVSATFTFDTTNVDRVQYKGGGNNNYADQSRTVTVNTGGTNSAVTTVIVDTSLANNTGGFSRPILARAYKNGYHSSSNDHTSVNKLQVNNQAPTFDNNLITYPAGQSALKNTQTADVRTRVNNQGGASAIYEYSSPTINGNTQLSITDSGTYAETKTVTRQSGDYNESTNNFQLTVKRVENGQSSTIAKTVKIAHAAPTINIISNNGNAMRSSASGINYTIRLTSDQTLVGAPILQHSQGTLQSTAPGNNVTFTGSGKNWQATMNVKDVDAKGTHAYSSLLVFNQANVTQTTINSLSSYDFAGFTSRTLVLGKFQRATSIGTNVATASKLSVSDDSYRQATILLDTSYTNGTQLNADVTVGENVASRFTITDSSNPNVVDLNGDMIWYLDREAVANNAGGSLQFTVEETI